jgi:hypothetical protein
MRKTKSPPRDERDGLRLSECSLRIGRPFGKTPQDEISLREISKHVRTRSALES